MRFKLLFFLVSFLCLSFQDTGDISRVREYYLKAKDNSADADNLFNLTKDKTGSIYRAYQGTSWAFRAKHHSNPIKKLEYLRKGLEQLNNAVVSDAINVEIRFLRFSVEDNIPSMISFTSHLNEDKQMIIGSLLPSHPFYKTIKAYMAGCKRLSKEEKAKLR